MISALKGVYEWSDGVTFAGTFAENTIDGRGKYTWWVRLCDFVGRLKGQAFLQA